MDLHILYPHLPHFLRGYLGSEFYTSQSNRPAFRRSLRLALRQAPADYPPGPVDPRLARQPMGIAALPVPVLPVTESSLLPHTLPMQPH